MASRAPRLLRVGTLVGASGVDGLVKLESFTDPRTAIFDYQPWLLRPPHGEPRTVTPGGGAPRGKGLVVRLPGVDSREQALALVGTEVLVDRQLLPAAAAGEFYWSDLEGLEVVTVDGVPLGRVSHLFETGANDVVVVRGERERLLPFLRPSVVKAIDLEAGRMVVDWDPEF